MTKSPFAIQRNFVPHDIDVTDVEQVKKLYDMLLDRPLSDDFRSSDDLEIWLAEFSELSSVIWETHARLSINNACHTDDPEVEKAYMDFVETVVPVLEPLYFEMQKKFLDCPFKDGVEFPGLKVLERNWKADVDIFNEDNIPLFTKDTRAKTDYGKINGEMMVEYDGEMQTLQQMARYQEETDRAVREETFKLSSERRYADNERLSEIFDWQLELRQTIAQNAGFDNYRDYIWKVKHRFDYTPADVAAYGDSIEKHCLPVIEAIAEKRKEAMGLETLKPWDGAVDPLGRSPLRPFDQNDINDFVDKTKEVFRRIDPRLADQFEDLRKNDNLDLESRKGKRPGGFQSSLEESREPFIFMNAAGTQRDVDTLIHEGGHAFHYQAARHLPLVFTRHAPLEFCEVASMGMELLACDHYNVYYETEADALRAKRFQLKGAISVLPWVATIALYQHWLYTNPGHSREARQENWLKILDRFSTKATDWTGFEHIRATMWQKQMHLYSVPFYYIEYGIAELGALQVWMNYRNNPQEALSNLLKAFELGNTVPLPEIYETAGIKFDFSEKTIAPLMEAVSLELSKLPE